MLHTPPVGISDGGQSLDPQWIDIDNNVSGVAYGCRDASPVAAGVGVSP